MRRRSLVLLVAAFNAAFAADPSEPLSFFKNYFVTGDYVIANVALSGAGSNGLATGKIVINTVPANADIVAAFLYWQSVETTPGQARKGKFRGRDIVGLQVGNRTSPCWSGGGATGSSNGRHDSVTYRADVMRHLKAANGQRIGNGEYEVVLPDSGSGKSPTTKGASIVMVYRAKGLPFKAVVLYNGAFTLDQSNDRFDLRVKGFYQPATVAPNGRLTHIVADGQANFSERLLVDGKLVATNPFQGLRGPWESYETPVTTFTTEGVLPTSIDREGLSSFDCLSMVVVAFSVHAQDTDKDGLLDTWEENGFVDVADGSVVNLPAMGAKKDIPDVFVEIDHMIGAQPSHTHRPHAEALKMVTDAFLSAPRPIRIHFDTGQGGVFNRGGEQIPETSSTLFPGYSGVIGWKSGLRSLQTRYFDHSRKDIFRYVLFAHALGIATAKPPAPQIPRTTSGIADLGGADAVVSLGLWRSENAFDQVGSPLQQAGTLMHELGHTLGLRHSGSMNIPGCQPNYQSSMNYLFQAGGLVRSDGTTVVDYSRKALPQLTEATLNESEGIGDKDQDKRYFARWYAPARTLLQRQLAKTGVKFVTRRCDGTPVGDNEQPMIKMEASPLLGYIDWNNDGLPTQTSVAADINFNGSADPTYFGSHDWNSVDLQQLGSRRNAEGLSGDIASGIDLPIEDTIYGDIASGDIASGDIASGDIASGDIASGDIASGVQDQSDLDFETYSATVEAPKNFLATALKSGISLSWAAPSIGLIREYRVYRAIGTITETNPPVMITKIERLPASPNTPPLTAYIDTATKKNTTYTYFVTAGNTEGAQSLPSDTRTLKQ